MPKDYFDFKKFRVFQDQCAMKVCTDSCLFGAWIEVINSNKILDIGAGTGLLSLMVAQRTKAQITAIEIDKSAFEQAKFNFENSIFNSNLTVIHISLQQFLLKQELPIFDTIICNPPFFKNYLKSNNLSINHAKHDIGLTLQDLANAIPILLSEKGIFYVLLPEYESKLFEKLMINFEKITELKVYNTEIDNKIFRIFSGYSYKNQLLDRLKSNIYIKNKINIYSNHFKTLLNDYYTIF